MKTVSSRIHGVDKTWCIILNERSPTQKRVWFPSHEKQKEAALIHVARSQGSGHLGGGVTGSGHRGGLLFLNLGTGYSCSVWENSKLWPYAICTHFNAQLKETVMSAMKSKLIKMALGIFPKLTSAFKLRVSQRPWPALNCLGRRWTG